MQPPLSYDFPFSLLHYSVHRHVTYRPTLHISYAATTDSKDPFTHILTRLLIFSVYSFAYIVELVWQQLRIAILSFVCLHSKVVYWYFRVYSFTCSTYNWLQHWPFVYTAPSWRTKIDYCVTRSVFGKKSSEQEVNRKIYTLATNFIIYSRNVTSFRSNLIEINVRKRGTW